MDAVTSGSAKKVRHIASDYTVNLNCRDAVGRTPLIAAVMYNDNADAVKALADMLVTNLNARDNDGLTALQHAVALGREDAALYLIKKQADPNVTDNFGRTPLHIAAAKGMTRAVDALLKNPKVNPVKRDGRHSTPLDGAVEEAAKGDPGAGRITECCEILQADPRVRKWLARNSDPEELLDFLPKEDVAKIVAKLQKIDRKFGESGAYAQARLRRAVRNEINKQLVSAASRGDFQRMTLVLDRGADIAFNHNNPLKAAVTYGRTDSVDFLLQHGADIAPVWNDCLKTAAGRGDQAMCDALLAHKPEDYNPWTHPALAAAVAADKSEVVTALLKAGRKHAAPREASYKLYRHALDNGYAQTAEALKTAGAATEPPARKKKPGTGSALDELLGGDLGDVFNALELEISRKSGRLDELMEELEKRTGEKLRNEDGTLRELEDLANEFDRIFNGRRPRGPRR